MTQWTTAEGAVRAIEPGATILLPPGCGEATAFEEALVMDRERLRGARLFSGLLLSEYPFLAPSRPPAFDYGTWHVMRPVRQALAAGDVRYFPLRASQVPGFVSRRGIDVAVVHVSPPDAAGYCSLGVSPSYSYPAARATPVLIAQVNRAMPRTRGDCRLHVSSFTHAFEVDSPLVEYRASTPDAISTRIAALVEPLIPDGASLQIGIGAIPEAILLALRDSGRRNLRLYGMGVDGAVDLWESGTLARNGPALIGGELMGTRRLFDWAHDHARCEMRDFPALFDPSRVAGVDCLVSLNSALEVDLWGNANSEVASGVQVSGLGGSLDFMEQASRTLGGRRILALAATAKQGSVSTIVPTLAAIPQSIPRSAVQWIATEYGAVDLSMLDLDARAEAMVGLAAPAFRDTLWNDYRAARRSRTADR
jgi:4-hydroxybutyrate CoA-transferase